MLINKNTICLISMITGLVLCGLGFTASEKLAFAQGSGPKNLKVLPKKTTKKELKTIMKGVSKALSVQCDHCHDMSDMSADTPTKKKARSMFKMVNTINKDLKKSGFSKKVSCMTCHNGNVKPAN